jgi:hypothetical protein
MHTVSVPFSPGSPAAFTLQGVRPVALRPILPDGLPFRASPNAFRHCIQPRLYQQKKCQSCFLKQKQVLADEHCWIKKIKKPIN